MNQHNVHVWHLIVGWVWYKTFTLKENIIQVNKNFVNIIEPWNEQYKGNGAISEILWSGNQLKVRVRVRKQNKSQPKPFLQMTRNTCWTELWAMSFWFCIHKRMKEFGLGKWKFYLENSWKKISKVIFPIDSVLPIWLPLRQSGEVFFCSWLLPMICV